MEELTLFSPAKINLFLAITGRREDGFHDLVSLACPISLGDELTVSSGKEGSGFGLECRGMKVPAGDDNLVLKAARAFSVATSWSGPARFILTKRIPHGAGLGGGSSNAVTTLRALNKIAGSPLPPEKLEELSASLGSDCPFFLHPNPVVMRGRGERIEPLPPPAAKRLCGLPLILFKPGFGVPTPWAYSQLAKTHDYTPDSEAESRLATWISDPSASPESLLFNGMENAVFSKFRALPAMREMLWERFGLKVHMTGSGSACFALIDNGMDTQPVESAIREAWGQSAFITRTLLAG